MKVTQGKVRGYQLQDSHIINLNPVLSYTRTRIFELINEKTHYDFKDKIGLDFFAGTGSFGIETLSQGAKQVDFVDNHPEAIKILKHNLVHNYFTTKYTIINQDARMFIERCYKKYDFIFIDPDSTYPILKLVIQELIPKLNSHGLLIINLNQPLSSSFYPLEVISSTKLTRSYLYILRYSH